jgi:hypothetical protein
VDASTRGGRLRAPRRFAFALLAWLALAALGAPPGSAAGMPPASGLCAYLHPSDAGVAWTCRATRRGETLESLFGDAWRTVARFNRVDRRHVRPGVWIKVPDRLDAPKEFTPLPQRYPPADHAAQFILIDLSEQFLGAYEYGALVLSSPVAIGRPSHPTPAGDFRIDAADRRHRSSRYTIARTSIPYPMHYALRFHRTRRGAEYWIHGRDLPGYPVSHGCVGLYDEAMQVRYYGEPKDVALDDARRLFEWAVGSSLEGKSARENLEGPWVRVVGRAPVRSAGASLGGC